MQAEPAINSSTSQESSSINRSTNNPPVTNDAPMNNTRRGKSSSNTNNHHHNNTNNRRNSSNNHHQLNNESSSSNNSRNQNNHNNNNTTAATFNYPTRILTFGFPFSGQPDIVRSLQKDEFYSNSVMFNNLKELCNWFFGQRFTIRFEREIQLVCTLIYYGTTTCSGQSTLGEEYCDLLQVQLKEKSMIPPPHSNNKFSIPKTLYIVKSTSSTRLLFVLYELIIPYLFDRGTSQWLSHHYFSPNGISENMRYSISMLKEFVQFILRFNLASFYVNGKFLQVSKRLAGIRYVSCNCNSI